MRNIFFTAAALALSLTGCAATISPVAVTRFHLGQPIPSGIFAVTAQPDTNGNTIEFRTYALAVANELSKLGYHEAASPLYTAEISYARDVRERLKQSPVTVGVGVGGGGGGLGVGIGTSFGVGDGNRDMVHTRLSVRLKRMSDATVIWEGRAETEVAENAPAAQPGLAAAKLATALFTGFPGESGKTIQVP